MRESMPLFSVAIYVVRAVVLIECAITQTGCDGTPVTVGPPKAAVKGKVLFQGQPLAQGIIVFLDSKGDPPRRYGSGIADGLYECEVTPGEKRVEITAMVIPTGSQTPDPGSNMKQIIPGKYNAKTTLAVTVSDKPSANKFDFDLKE